MTNSSMSSQNNVRFVSSNYPEKQPCWGTKRSAWDSNEEAPSSPLSSMTKLSSSSPSRSLYQRILYPPKRQELFIYELPECLFIHDEEEISELSEEFVISYDEDEEEETIVMTTTVKIRAPKIKSILKKSQYKIESQALTGPQLQTSKSKSRFKSEKNRNKNKKNVPATRRVSDSISDSNLSDSTHTTSTCSSSSSSSSMNKTSTSLSRKHRDSFLDLRSLLVRQRNGLKREDSITSSTSTLSIAGYEYGCDCR
jgi:hypothetical protein